MQEGFLFQSVTDSLEEDTFSLFCLPITTGELVAQLNGRSEEILKIFLVSNSLTDACKKLTKKMSPAQQSACTFICLEFCVICRFDLLDLTLDIFISFTPALPDGTGTNSEIPLKICLKKKYFELVYLLLTKGADPRNVSIAQGDTPLHAAVSICLNNRGKACVCLGQGVTKGSRRSAPFVFTAAVENVPVSYLSSPLPLLLLFTDVIAADQGV